MDERGYCQTEEECIRMLNNWSDFELPMFDKFRENKAVVIESFKFIKVASAWGVLDKAGRLKDDMDVALAALRKNGMVFQLFSERLRADKELVMFAVGKYGNALDDASEDLRADREVVLAAVKNNGIVISCASTDLRGDREVAMAAIESSHEALGYASEELRADWELQRLSLHRALHYSFGESPTRLLNKKFDKLWSLREKFGESLQFFERVVEEIKPLQTYYLLSDEQRANHDIAVKSLVGDWDNDDYVPSKLWENTQFLLKLLEGGFDYENLGSFLCQHSEVMQSIDCEAAEIGCRPLELLRETVFRELANKSRERIEVVTGLSGKFKASKNKI